MFDYGYRIAIALNYLNSLVDCNSIEESDLHNLMILIDPDEDNEELIADAISYANMLSSMSVAKSMCMISNAASMINSAASMFKKELEYVATMMQRNDPNGTYTPDEIARKPLAYIEVLEQWKEDCGYEGVPAWIDKCIDYLMLLLK